MSNSKEPNDIFLWPSAATLTIITEEKRTQKRIPGNKSEKKH